MDKNYEQLHLGFDFVCSNDYKEVGLIDSNVMSFAEEAVKKIRDYYLYYYSRLPSNLELDKLFELARQRKS